MPPRGNINPKTVAAPLAAFSMAWVLFAYTRSSIRAAKEEARNRPMGERRSANKGS